jgi:hypothetical protein
MTTQLGLKEKDTRTFINILGSDGTLRMTVPEGTPNSVDREYETSDGKTGVKHELIYKEIAGYITDMELYEGDYGTNIIVEIAINEEKTEKRYLSIGTGSSFGEDFMKKLPRVDFTKVVVLSPYSFEDEKGKMKRGITVIQDDQKLVNFFYDKETEKNTNGFPEPKGDTRKYTKDKWKSYFLDVRIFLTEYMNENVIKKVFGHAESKTEDF